MGTQKNSPNETVLLNTQNIIEPQYEISKNVVCVTSINTELQLMLHISVCDLTKLQYM